MKTKSRTISLGLAAAAAAVPLVALTAPPASAEFHGNMCKEYGIGYSMAVLHNGHYDSVVLADHYDVRLAGTHYHVWRNRTHNYTNTVQCYTL